MDNEIENPKTVGMTEHVEPVEVVEPEEIIEPPDDAHCPSCNGPGIRKGKTILCETCDCSFRYTKEGSKVDEVGPLEARVARLEGLKMPEPKVAQPAEPEKPQPAEPEKPQPVEPEDDGI